MDPYDPEFDPENYNPQKDAPHPDYDPGTNSGVHGDQPPAFERDIDVLPTGDEVYDNQKNVHVHHDETYEEYPGYEEYPDAEDDIPRHVGEGYSDDDMDYENDGFGDDDDVYLDNHRNNAAHEIESSDPKDAIPDNLLRNCILTCSCIFILSGLIVLGIKIGQISDEDAAKTQPARSSAALVPPPLDLGDKCSNKNVLSEKGFYQCEQVCEAADCCNYPTTLALSCLAGHDDECFQYHQHCNVLKLDEESLVEPPKPPTDIPEAPQEIKNKCNIESLRTVPGFEGCVNDCMRAECCWKKDGSVHPCTELDICQGYSPCLTMDVTDHVDYSIEKEIQQKCSDVQLTTEVGRNQCIFACSHAACCFDPDAQCPHEDGHFCTQYEPCNKIYDANGEVIQGGSANANDIPLAPEFLSTACEVSSLKTLPGFEMCQGACSEAECCWKGSNSCSGDSGCEGYESCVNLDGQENLGDMSTSETIPEAPEYLAAACSEGSLDTSAGFEMCQDACMKAECCWKVSSCSARSECSSYSEHCSNLVAHLDGNDSGSSSGGGVFIPMAPNDLDQTCDPSKVLTSTGFQACEFVCQKSECCWKTGATDSCVANSACQAWSACTIMNGSTEPPQTESSTTPPQTGGSTSASESQDYTLEQVFDACLNHDNNVGSNHKSLCQIVCQAGNCCFDEGKVCASGTDCKIFDPCQVLHSQKTSDVEKACDGSDLSECVGICSDATCCFTNDIAKICDITSPDIICRQYKACEVLYSAEINGGL